VLLYLLCVLCLLQVGVINEMNYDFRFLKTNGRHIDILLPVSVLTLSLATACDSASAYRISSESDRSRWL